MNIVRRSASRIVALFITTLAIIGTVAITSVPAFAETSVASQTSNMYMSWSQQPMYTQDPVTCQYKPSSYQSVSGVYETDLPDLCGYPQEYYSCYTVDCGGVVVNGTTAKLNLITDQHLLNGWAYYSSTTTNDGLSQSMAWNGKPLPLSKSAYVDGHWVTMTLQEVSAAIYWSDFPVPPSLCNDTTNPCKGGGGMK